MKYGYHETSMLNVTAVGIVSKKIYLYGWGFPTHFSLKHNFSWIQIASVNIDVKTI